MRVEIQPYYGVNEIDEIIFQLRCIAIEFEIPVLVVSRLNRVLEYKVDHHPKLYHLRDSGSIEDLADIVLLLYRDEVYHADSDDKGIIEIIIAENNAGPTGVVRLAFAGRIPRIFNFAG